MHYIQAITIGLYIAMETFESLTLAEVTNVLEA